MKHWTQLQRSSAQTIRAYQNKKLNEFVNFYLYPFSPFYKKLFDQHQISPRAIRSVEDLAQLPFTTKNDFVDETDPDKFRKFVLQPSLESIKKAWPMPKLLALKLARWAQGEPRVRGKLNREFRPVFMTFTSGTTQNPVAYFYSRHDIHNLSVAGERLIDVLDVAPADYLLNLFPYAPHLAFWQVVLGGLAAGNFILSTGGGKVYGTEGNIKAITKFRPSVLMGTPGYVYHILREAKERGCALDFLRKVVLGAARIEPFFKIKLAELLTAAGAGGVKVLGTYGFTEARMAWTECPADNSVSTGYHTYPDKEIFEIIDPETGRVRGEGEDGELVYTSIDSRGSSVLRYRTGDFVKGGITYRPCPHCGRTVPRISSDISRFSDVKDLRLTKIKGSLVNLSKCSFLLSEFRDIEEWQLEICKKDDDPYELDRINIYVACKESVCRDDLKEALTKKFRLETEVSPNAVIFLPLKDMISRLELEIAGKEKRIIDRRVNLMHNIKNVSTHEKE
ncbi:MAG: AMP-binding protein [Candidatus Omnitrophota bacterium]|jgi:phenylacetate-coenzyme A ligase PaaK-like adenylate-forming protein